MKFIFKKISIFKFFLDVETEKKLAILEKKLEGSKKTAKTAGFKIGDEDVRFKKSF